MSEKITVSSLPKTYILDLDGTIVKHNGYKLDGHDTLLAGSTAFLSHIQEEDMVIIVTSRTQECAQSTEAFLAEQGIRYHSIIYGAPYGERILVNDRKVSGLSTAIAINIDRDEGIHSEISIDPAL